MSISATPKAAFYVKVKTPDTIVLTVFLCVKVSFILGWRMFISYILPNPLPTRRGTFVEKIEIINIIYGLG